MGGFEVKNDITLTVTVSIEAICELQKPSSCAAVLARMDERMDNFCKRRAEYLRRSLLNIHTQRGQWQASFNPLHLNAHAQIQSRGYEINYI